MIEPFWRIWLSAGSSAELSTPTEGEVLRDKETGDVVVENDGC